MLQHSLGRLAATAVRDARCIQRPAWNGVLNGIARFGVFRSLDDTVMAVSTPPGRGAVAIIRISGPATGPALQALTVAGTPVAHGSSSSTTVKPAHSSLPQPRMAAKRQIRDPTTGELLDDGLVIWFPGPKSFTGEDVAELHLHGSPAVVSSVLHCLTAQGCRTAEPGEFTRRAFANNKMDITEVEGLADLISANTEAQRRQALTQMSGALSHKYEAWRATIVKALAHVEAVIDFGEDEDDCSSAVYDAVWPRVRELTAEIKQHLADGNRGEIVREGLRIGIVGPPNAGKSSLLNVLAKRPAAIVSAIPGTTRDVVEVAMNLGGFEVRVSDTAGIRETTDIIEQEGVVRAKAVIAHSDMVLYVFDTQSLLSGTVDPAAVAMVPPDAFVILNKGDTVTPAQAQQAKDRYFRAVKDWWVVSCTQQTGVQTLVSNITEKVQQRLTAHGSLGADVVITRARHREHLNDCITHLDAFLAKPKEADIAAEELRLATQAIGRITGRVDVEEMLDVLFKDFCIGK